MKKRWGILLLAGLLVILIGLIVGLFFGVIPPQKKSAMSAKMVAKSPDQPLASEPPPTRRDLPARADLPGQPALQSARIPLAVPGERSPIADNLNLPNQDVGADLQIVTNLLNEYRRTYGVFPTGENNAQIVNALSGNNQKKRAFLDPTNPAISTRGELFDRWGTPYFFHLQSSQEVEIRSAGPDHEFYTADDVLLDAR